MMLRPLSISITILAALAALEVEGEGTARADEFHRERTITSEPNYGLIGSGVVTLGISYGASVVVGATSGLEADRYLFLPIVGPWIDLAVRPGCPITRLDCDVFDGHETAAKAGLIVDGIFQGLGALSIAGGFLWRREIHVRDTTATVQVSPYGSGLLVSGTF